MPDEIVSSQNLTDSYPELSAKPVDRRPMIYGIVAAIVIILIFGGLGFLLFYYPEATATIRDIFIIFMGLGIFVVILLLIALVVITAYLVLKVNDLFQLLDREVRPVLSKLQQTTNTVGGTTTFISEQAVRPVISTASNISAVRAIFKALFQRT